MERLEERSGEVSKASAGSVHPVLRQLEGGGLVRQDEQAGKKIDHLPDPGTGEVHNRRDAIEATWKQAHGWRDRSSTMGPGTAEIQEGRSRLSRAAFTAASSSDSHEMERIREILDRARTELEAL